MKVVVPQTGTLSTQLDGNPDVTISGQGRFVGFALNDLGKAIGRVLIVGRLADDAFSTDNPFDAALCGSVGSCPPYGPVTPQFVSGFDNDGVLPWPNLVIPAGTYRLSVIADGGPVTISLRLHGLSGTATIAPTNVIHPIIADAAPTVAVPGQPEAWFADSGELGSSVGIQFTVTWIRVLAESEGFYTYCASRNGPPPLGPACAGTRLYWGAEDVPPTTAVFMGINYPLTGNPGQAVHFERLWAVDKIGGVMVWLPTGASSLTGSSIGTTICEWGHLAKIAGAPGTTAGCFGSTFYNPG